jgi:glycosyltransferase involved in cell wall biosynthesis
VHLAGDDVPAPHALRIAMLGSKGIPARHGGIERHVEEVAQRLAQRGHRVDVFTRAYHPFREAFFAGVRLRRRPSLSTKHLDAASHTALCALEAGLSARYDILHIHGIGPGLFVGWTPRVRTVFTFHAQDWRQKKWGAVARWFLQRGEANAVRRADAVITVSKLLQRYVQDIYGRHCTYIPNGARHVGAPEPEALQRWQLTPESYLLFVGRIIADRGLGTLLDAFARVPTSMRLVIAGEVQMPRAAFTSLRARAGEAVVFTGHQPSRVLDALYAQAFLCVHPSEVEGLPIAVLDAMGNARTVVVSDIPENLEAVGDAGVTFPVGDAPALAATLSGLLETPERVRELGERAQERARTVYRLRLGPHHTTDRNVVSRRAARPRATLRRRSRHRLADRRAVLARRDASCYTGAARPGRCCADQEPIPRGACRCRSRVQSDPGLWRTLASGTGRATAAGGSRCRRAVRRGWRGPISIATRRPSTGGARLARYARYRHRAPRATRRDGCRRLNQRGHRHSPSPTGISRANRRL